MGREYRARSESNHYHVFIRGVGRQILFEDDDDRATFLDLMNRAASKQDAQVIAWCLMSNHVHLLVEADLDELSSLMKRLEVSYARWFNARHDRVGTLFQGRFGSEPIKDEAQLLCAIRYIHKNPEAAGMCLCRDYRWSSYGAFLAAETDGAVSWPLDIFGDAGSFKRFHEEPDEDDAFMEDTTFRGKSSRRRMTDREAIELGDDMLGEGWRSRIGGLPRSGRDEMLALLRKAGLTIRQIERLTGIGRGIVAKAHSPDHADGE